MTSGGSTGGDAARGTMLAVGLAPALRARIAGLGFAVDDGGATPALRFLDGHARLILIDAADAALPALAEAAITRGAALATIGGSVALAGVTHLVDPAWGDATLGTTLDLALATGRRLAGDGAAEPVIAAGEERRAATRDAVTGSADGMAARRWLERRLGAGGPAVHAILIGISRFEMVNVAYGRAAGDTVLRAVASRLGTIANDLFGRDRLVARTAGSEFAVLGALDVRREHVALAADRIADALAKPFVAGGAVVSLGARIGIASAAPGASDAATLLRDAGEALAEARGADGPTVRYALTEPGLPPAYDLAVDLRRAIAEDEVEILFQPQVAIASGRIVGAEALARWLHPTLGLLGAETLFAAADRADLALALSDHVQRRTLARAASWPAALSGLRLALNVTALDVHRPGFADMLIDRVDASGLPRSRVTVEITEGSLIEDLATAADLFARLRAAGIRVAIDDFGTGYSSLAYLKALPLDYLKIDKTLAQDITGSPRDRIVVRGVIDMARALGLTVIAEGVETGDQLDLLAKEGCNIYQGFLCAEPLDVAALASLVTEAA